MVSSIYFGNIKLDRLKTWNENKDPYDILEENYRINRISGWEFLSLADKLFTEKVQVDWGSFAYKCNTELLRDLANQTRCEIDLSLVEDNGRIGIVFIEES